MTRYRLRTLGDHSGLSAREFDTPAALGHQMGSEFGAMAGVFVVKAVEDDGTERELTEAEEDASTFAFEAALTGAGVELGDGGELTAETD